MFKKVGLVVLIGLLVLAGNVYALRQNASPAVIGLDRATNSREITFPYLTRDLYIDNYDTNTGIWVNLRGGDTNGIDVTSQRTYIAPSNSLELFDFQTRAITIFKDRLIQNADGIASPIVVLSVY